MPDGFGNDMPSWAMPAPSPKLPDPAWVMAYHLRLEHGMAYHKIAKRTGLPYEEVRLRLRDSDG